MKKYKYKVGDILIWHREWFTDDMNKKIIIEEIIDNEIYPYKAKFYEPDRHTYREYNIYSENELYEIGKYYQLKLF